MIPRKALGRSSRELPVLGLDWQSGPDFGVELALGGPRWPHRKTGPTGLLEELPTEPLEAVILAYPSDAALARGTLLRELACEKEAGRFSLCGLRVDTPEQGYLAVYLDLFDFLVIPYNPFQSQADVDLFWAAQARDCGVIVVEPTGLDGDLRRWSALEAGLEEFQGHVPWLALQFALHHPAVTSVCPRAGSAFEWKEWLQGLMLPALTREQHQGVKRAAVRA